MQGRNNKVCTESHSGHSRKVWITIAISVCLLILGLLVAYQFTTLVNLIVNHKLTLRVGNKAYDWWANPSVEPKISFYVYNVTNANDFLNNASKPILDEVGPYVYTESWGKVNIVTNPNGTLSYTKKKIYVFREDLSAGKEDDNVIVPNIPMLTLTSQSKHTIRFLRVTMGSIMSELKLKPFIQVSIGQLLWGYEDPLLKLSNDLAGKDVQLPYEEFGLMYGKNGTSTDRITIFTGVDDITQYGIIDKYNGKSHLPHWLSEECNRLNGTDGSIFPPHIDKNRVLHVYDKDLCRLLPLVFEKEVEVQGKVKGYRFTPPSTVFSDVDSHPENMCFCPAGQPSCSPNGLFNVSLCQLNAPIMLSFPHFYLGDESLRKAVEGISPSQEEKHKFFIDVQPTTGTTLRARARIQINLAVSQVTDIEEVANFPDIVFPILWFEEGIDNLPEEITDLMNFAETVPPKIRSVLLVVFFSLGAMLFLLALFYLVRNTLRRFFKDLTQRT